MVEYLTEEELGALLTDGKLEERQVDLAFWTTLGRDPSEVEAQAALAVAREHGLATVGRVLFNSNEFLFLP